MVSVWSANDSGTRLGQTEATHHLLELWSDETQYLLSYLLGKESKGRS